MPIEKFLLLLYICIIYVGIKVFQHIPVLYILPLAAAGLLDRKCSYEAMLND